MIILKRTHPEVNW